jgi:type II secretory pathway pseudopilin PulG
MKFPRILLASAAILSGLQIAAFSPSALAQATQSAIRAGETILGEFRTNPPTAGASGAAITNVDTYTFQAMPGDFISVRAFPNGSTVTSPIIPLITLTDPLGNVFAMNSPAGIVTVPNSLTGGTWTVTVSSANNVAGDYTLSVAVSSLGGETVIGVNNPFGGPVY